MTQIEMFHGTNLLIWINNNMQIYSHMSSWLDFIVFRALLKTHLAYLYKRKENLHAHKYLEINVYSGLYM
jgi:hypothetical protein